MITQEEFIEMKVFKKQGKSAFEGNQGTRIPRKIDDSQGLFKNVSEERRKTHPEV